MRVIRMKITGVASYVDLNKTPLQGKTAIMIDTLRASATIVTAVSNGCDRIVPTAEANEAAAIKKISEGSMLLCGEIEARMVSGFDLGNSPLEYKRELIEDRVLIYATTNGSVAIKRLAQAEDILIASFVNATAVAKRAYGIGNEIMLVCAGSNGEFSTDDIIAMGCLVDRLLVLDPNLEMDDLCRMALKLYDDSRGNFGQALAGSKHFEYLMSLGLYEDIEYCLKEDVFDIVPVYREGVITK